MPFMWKSTFAIGITLSFAMLTLYERRPCSKVIWSQITASLKKFCQQNLTNPVPSSWLHPSRHDRDFPLFSRLPDYCILLFFCLIWLYEHYPRTLMYLVQRVVACPVLFSTICERNSRSGARFDRSKSRNEHCDNLIKFRFTGIMPIQ